MIPIKLSKLIVFNLLNDAQESSVSFIFPKEIMELKYNDYIVNTVPSLIH